MWVAAGFWLIWDRRGKTKNYSDALGWWWMHKYKSSIMGRSTFERWHQRWWTLKHHVCTSWLRFLTSRCFLFRFFYHQSLIILLLEMFVLPYVNVSGLHAHVWLTEGQTQHPALNTCCIWPGSSNVSMETLCLQTKPLHIQTISA